MRKDLVLAAGKEQHSTYDALMGIGNIDRGACCADLFSGQIGRDRRGCAANWATKTRSVSVWVFETKCRSTYQALTVLPLTNVLHITWIKVVTMWKEIGSTWWMWRTKEYISIRYPQIGCCHFDWRHHLVKVSVWCTLRIVWHCSDSRKYTKHMPIPNAHYQAHCLR